LKESIKTNKKIEKTIKNIFKYITLNIHMNEKIDETDIMILGELQKDARSSFREIADKLSIAEGTVYNRVNKLKESGVIRGFIPDIDYSKLGYEFVVVIGVIVEGGHLPEIEKEIAKSRNVTAVYDVTGEYDALVIAKFKTRDDLNKLVKEMLAIPRVRRTNTMVVLNTMKESHGVEF